MSESLYTLEIMDFSLWKLAISYLYSSLYKWHLQFMQQKKKEIKTKNDWKMSDIMLHDTIVSWAGAFLEITLTILNYAKFGPETP